VIADFLAWNNWKQGGPTHDDETETADVDVYEVRALLDTEDRRPAAGVRAMPFAVLGPGPEAGAGEHDWHYDRDYHDGHQGADMSEQKMQAEPQHTWEMSGAMSAQGMTLTGITLRQWYAGLAMQGMLAKQAKDCIENPALVVKAAFALADLMVWAGKA
jgi:hypothetical protein